MMRTVITPSDDHVVWEADRGVTRGTVNVASAVTNVVESSHFAEPRPTDSMSSRLTR